MAFYTFCQHSYYRVYPDCYAILIVYQSMLSLYMCYMNHVVRLVDLGKDIGPLCFQACSSSLRVHLKGGRPREARVVTSYTGVMLWYA